MRRKWLSGLTSSELVSESPCVLCPADKIQASYLLGSTSFLFRDRREPLVAPVQPQDQSVFMGDKAWKFQDFLTPSPLLAPIPTTQPPP